MHVDVQHALAEALTSDMLDRPVVVSVSDNGGIIHKRGRLHDVGIRWDERGEYVSWVETTDTGGSVVRHHGDRLVWVREEVQP